jgi:prepilin-type N-terminal cleavage/methylation domain-containing protein
MRIKRLEILNEDILVMQQNRGFSLIEMMVVVGIMGILLVTGVASYNRLNDRAKVEQAAQLLATELRVIQKKADAGINGCASSSFQGVSVGWDNDSRKISWSDECEGAFFGDSGFTPDQPLSSSSINVSLEPSSFVFYPVGRGVSQEATFSLSMDENSFQVVVQPSGAIRVEKM